MRKFLLLLLLSGLAHIGFAQTAINAGTVELGGSINYLHKEENTKSNTTYTSNLDTFTATPYLGYFVANNLAVGVNLGYTVQETKDVYISPSSSPTYRTYSSLRLGPYVRYYKLLTEQFGFTGTLSGGYSRDSQPASSNTRDGKSSGFYSGFTPGIIFLPIPKLGIGASIGGLAYTRLSVHDTGSYSDVTSTFGASFGLAQLTFSGTYFFGR